jgi:hypothetical protein
MIPLMLAIVCLGGAVGGLVNALLTDNGFIAPRWESTESVRIWRPGVVGNVLIGFVAAGISWGLYGPLSAAPLLRSAPAAAGTIEPMGTLTLAGLVGAVLVGVAGARWLTSEVDKKLLRAAASQAATGEPSLSTASKLLLASPAQAVKITKNP